MSEKPCAARIWDYKLGGMVDCGHTTLDGRVLNCDRHNFKRGQQALELLREATNKLSIWLRIIGGSVLIPIGNEVAALREHWGVPFMVCGMGLICWGIISAMQMLERNERNSP